MDEMEFLGAVQLFVYDQIAWDYVPESAKVLVDYGLCTPFDVVDSYPWCVSSEVSDLIRIVEQIAFSEPAPESEPESESKVSVFALFPFAFIDPGFSVLL